MVDLSGLDWKSVVAGLPAVGAVAKTLLPTRDRQLENRVKRHSELLAQLPAEVEGTELREVIRLEIAEIARRGRQRLHRTIDWSTVFAMLLVVAVAAASVLGLFSWAGNSPDPWSSFLKIIAWLVGLFTFLLITVGAMPQVWKTTEEPEEQGKPAV